MFHWDACHSCNVAYFKLHLSIFHISSFPYRGNVKQCVKLSSGNHPNPRRKKVALKKGCDIYFKVMLTQNESKKQDIYQQIAPLKAACFES